MDNVTEILTKRGFMGRGSITKNDIIVGVDLKTMTVSENEILKVSHRAYSGNVVRVENKNTDFVVTCDSDIIIKSGELLQKTRASELYYNGGEILINVVSSGDEYDLTDDMIRLYVWLVADGSLCNTSLGRFHFRKDRKIERLCSLLDRLNVSHYKSLQRSGNTKINFTIPEVLLNLGIKPISREVLLFSQRQKEIVFEEYIHTDGNKTGNSVNSYQVTTVKEDEANTLQELFITSGKSCNMKKCRNNKSIRYVLSINTNKRVSKVSKDFKLPIRNEFIDGECFWYVKTHNDAVITRRNGKVAIMGGNDTQENQYGSS